MTYYRSGCIRSGYEWIRKSQRNATISKDNKAGIPGARSTTTMMIRLAGVHCNRTSQAIVFGEDLEPATISDEMIGDSFSIRQQSATATHLFRVQPYNAAALSDCRSVLEEVDPWGLVCYH
jgi:hypothetical protein